MDLPIGKVLEETAAQQEGYILPIVVPLVSNFLLENAPDGNYCREYISEQHELQEEFTTEDPHRSCKKHCTNARQLNNRCEQLENPKIRKRQCTDPAVPAAEQHVPIAQESVQQALLPTCALDRKSVV